MSNTLEMFTPLTPESALGRLVQGLCGKNHELCSSLQHEECEHKKICLGHDCHALPICRKIVFTAYVEQDVEKEG